MDNEAEFLSNLLSDDGGVDSEPDYSKMFVVAARFKDSAEADAAEQQMIEAHENADFDRDIFSWPKVFVDAAGNVEPPSKRDAENLVEHFGVSVEEYMQCYERKSP